MTGGISAIEHGFIIKVLGNNAQQLQNVTSLLKHTLTKKMKISQKNV